MLSIYDVWNPRDMTSSLISVNVLEVKIYIRWIVRVNTLKWIL